MLEQVEKEDLKSLTEVLQTMQEVFHENHYYVLETKRRILESISDYEDVATSLLGKLNFYR